MDSKVTFLIFTELDVESLDQTAANSRVGGFFLSYLKRSYKKVILYGSEYIQIA